jgi:hypothetical protein
MYGNLIYFLTSTKKSKRIDFILGHMAFIFIFGLFYYITYLYLEPDGFIKANDDTNLSLWDCIHFSLVTQTTVGYGGLVPMGKFTKFINALQLLTIFGVVVINLL